MIPICYDRVMPTNSPARADRELSRRLAERGIDRSPVTCLRWRRDGVLLPPDGYDENDEPVLSDAAIDRAVTYAQLLDRLGRDDAIVALWGSGADLPRRAALRALRRRWDARIKSANADAGRMAAHSTAARRQRAVAQDIATRWPEAGKSLTAAATRAAAEDAEGDEPPTMTEKRADLLMLAAADYADDIEAGDDVAKLVDALPITTEVRDAVEAEGGIPTLADGLAVFETCDKDDEAFDRLCAMRDAMRQALTEHRAEFVAAFPWIPDAAAWVGSDPAVSGPVFAEGAVVGFVLEARAQEAAEQGANVAKRTA